MKINKFLKKNFSLIIAALIGLIFGSFLMFSSFSSENNEIFVSSKAWSDFASHVPLIRSFSLGDNFPVEYPLFSGEPIKYHFVFYFLVGTIEKLGIPLSLALNIPSIVGFVLLTTTIFLLAKKIFKSNTVGLMSVMFFIFNSSLSFIYFFKKYPLSTNSINQIINNENFLSFAPYGDGVISAFWNLNIYTNQRHLALAFALSLIAVFIVLKPVIENKKADYRIFIALGIFMGILFYFHVAVFLMTAIVIFSLGILFKPIRYQSIILLLTSAVLAFPQYIYLNSSSGFSPIFNFGYLIATEFTITKFIEFWILNLGISLILIPLGIIFSNKIQRKIFIAFFLIFIVGNSIQFSIEIAANHKFFNYFMLVGNMFSAYAIYVIWKKKNLFKPIAVIAFILMIFGGVIDFFPLYNDNKISLADYNKNLSSSWIEKNTPKKSIFLNTTFLYSPASLAGRKVFFGWPYFAWSQGYDTYKRDELYKRILSTNDKELSCKLLLENNIDYIELIIQNPPDPNIPTISNVYKEEFIASFEDKSTNTTIINVKNNCL